MKESERPGSRITMRVSKELAAQIKALAKRDRRTVANWCVVAVEDAVAVATKKKQ